MRIAHLVPTLHTGGSEFGLSDLAGAAREVGMELVVIALASTSDTAEVGALRRLGVPVAELGLGPWDPRAVARTARLLTEHRIDLVHTHLPVADVVGAAAASRHRLPVVSTLHHIENLPAGRADRLRRSAKILARQRFMARTIAVSQVQREWYRGLAGPDPTVLVVPNGVADPGPVDPGMRRRQRATLEIDDTVVLAQFTAPMRRDQGHELLLDAVEALPDGLPLVVALVGDGPLRPWLESRVDAGPALAERVLFVHHTQSAEMLAASDIALHTATVGAQPTALLRAMAAGLPAIATRVGGVPELVTTATGVLVPLDPRPIADALVALASDDIRRARLGSAARARFLGGFEAVAWARRLRELYASVLTDHHGHGNPIDGRSSTRHTSRS